MGWFSREGRGRRLPAARASPPPAVSITQPQPRTSSALQRKRATRARLPQPTITITATSTTSRPGFLPQSFWAWWGTPIPCPACSVALALYAGAWGYSCCGTWSGSVSIAFRPGVTSFMNCAELVHNLRLQTVKDRKLMYRTTQRHKSLSCPLQNQACRPHKPDGSPPLPDPSLVPDDHSGKSVC